MLTPRDGDATPVVGDSIYLQYNTVGLSADISVFCSVYSGVSEAGRRTEIEEARLVGFGPQHITKMKVACHCPLIVAEADGFEHGRKCSYEVVELAW